MRSISWKYFANDGWLQFDFEKWQNVFQTCGEWRCGNANLKNRTEQCNQLSSIPNEINTFCSSKSNSNNNTMVTLWMLITLSKRVKFVLCLLLVSFFNTRKKKFEVWTKNAWCVAAKMKNCCFRVKKKKGNLGNYWICCQRFWTLPKIQLIKLIQPQQYSEDSSVVFNFVNFDIVVVA